MFTNDIIVLFAAAIFVFLAIPKKASSKKSGDKKLNIPFANIFGWIWAIVKFPFTVGAFIAGLFTSKDWIKNTVGALALILFYLLLFFWMRDNVPAAAALLP